MSEEDIPNRDDKEDLMYIYKKFKLESYGLKDDVSEENSSSTDSILPLQCFESDLNLCNIIGKQIGPNISNNPEMIAKTKPFDFLWTYGINTKVGMINLTTEERKEIFFAGSHFPILYDYCTKQMKCLEGHQYLVSSISADTSGQWLVTADDNKDGCVIIWDSNEFKPIYTLFGIYTTSGVILVRMSGSARYLITVGLKNEGSYSVDMWLWTLGNDQSEGSFEIDKRYGLPMEVCFNPNIEEFIMIICKKKVFFLVWDTKENKFVPSKPPQITHPNKTGTLTTGSYCHNCHQCYACSSKGCVLIFGNTLYCKPFEEGELDNSKIYINAVKISECALRSIATTTTSVVVGDANGTIYFFDQTIKILYWLTKFNLAPVVSISFNKTPKFKKEDLLSIYTVPPRNDRIFECDYTDISEDLEIVLKTHLPKDASLKNEAFLVTDFVIATMDGNMYAIDFLNKKCTPIFITADDHVSAIDTHDELPYLVVGYANGRIHLVDYEKNELVSSTMLPKTEDSTSISCIKFSPESLHLVCGRENGEIWILEPVMLQPKTAVPFRPKKKKVVKIVFSTGKGQFAYYDVDRTVVLFIYSPDTCEWKCVGKIQSHYLDINDIIFMPHNQGSILYTIACDRHLVEYNNRSAGKKEFGIVCRERIEQRAIPMSFIYWCESTRGRHYDYLLIADNEHKFKLLDLESKIPKLVILAPAYGCFKNQIINKMMVIPKTDDRYMIFLASKYIGLHMALPDGNPYKYVGYLGHPSKVVDFNLSSDGKYMFTFGTDDHCVLKWKIRTKSVELMHLLGGKELEPFYCLIEGGKNGWLFQEIKDLFYYMQILQHESIDCPRRVTDAINITELPELVRTCGFYPSEFELENMMLDIKYRNYNETGILNTEINFIDFVKLFCNHKPVYGYCKDKIKKAFETVVENSDSAGDDEINREEFASILAYSGEFISPSHLLKILKTLLRSDHAAGNLEFLPEVINFKTLYEEILGIDMERSRIMEYESEGAPDLHEEEDNESLE